MTMGQGFDDVSFRRTARRAALAAASAVRALPLGSSGWSSLPRYAYQRQERAPALETDTFQPSKCARNVPDGLLLKPASPALAMGRPLVLGAVAVATDGAPRSEVGPCSSRR